MKTVLALLVAIPVTLLACGKDKPSDGDKMMPAQPMAAPAAMATPGSATAPSAMGASSAGHM